MDDFNQEHETIIAPRESGRPFPQPKNNRLTHTMFPTNLLRDLRATAEKWGYGKRGGWLKYIHTLHRFALENSSLFRRK